MEYDDFIIPSLNNQSSKSPQTKELPVIHMAAVSLLCSLKKEEKLLRQLFPELCHNRDSRHRTRGGTQDNQAPPSARQI